MQKRLIAMGVGPRLSHFKTIDAFRDLGRKMVPQLAIQPLKQLQVGSGSGKRREMAGQGVKRAPLKFRM